ncbi:hypothetical protein BTE48_16995, partial [Oceanospirillum multiglobuliferum]
QLDIARHAEQNHPIGMRNVERQAACVRVCIRDRRAAELGRVEAPIGRRDRDVAREDVADQRARHDVTAPVFLEEEFAVPDALVHRQHTFELRCELDLRHLIDHGDPKIHLALSQRQRIE